MDDINIYECKDGRLRVYIKAEKRVMSYPKYLMEKAIGRKLMENEQTHHLDKDPLNNDPSNLELTVRGEHQRLHNPRKYFDKLVCCEWCGKEFVWTAQQQSNHYGNHTKNSGREATLGKPF